MSSGAPFIQHSFKCGCESWQCKGVSSAIYMRFWRSYNNRMRSESSMKWSDVAILAFTFCSRVLFVKHGRKTVLKVLYVGFWLYSSKTNTIICLQIFKKHGKLTYLFIWKTMLQSVILLWKCAFRPGMSVFVIVCETRPLPVYPIVFRHPGLPAGVKRSVFSSIYLHSVAFLLASSGTSLHYLPPILFTPRVLRGHRYCRLHSTSGRHELGFVQTPRRDQRLHQQTPWRCLYHRRGL